MTQPAPAPVHSFFAAFLANPDSKGFGVFLVNLLELELSRAEHGVLSDPPAVAVGGGLDVYKSDITQTRRALKLANRTGMPRYDQIDLRYYWLKLFGNRVAVERGLPVGGRPALRHVAALRMGLALKDAEAWSDETLFKQYTQTVLRDEWDYGGLRFRTPGHDRPAGSTDASNAT